MRKKIGAVIVFLLVMILTGCKEDNKDKIFGDYVFDKVIYLAVFSSSTPDYIEEGMKDATYTIKDDIFKITASNLEFQKEACL